MHCKHLIQKEVCKFDGISLCRCDKCGLVFVDKCFKVFNAKKIYEKFYSDEVAGRFSFGIECVIRLFRLFRAFKIFTIHPQAKSILDLGSGRGFMLYYLKKYYKYQRTVGTQISKNAFEFSKNKLCLEVYDKDLLELNLKSTTFDVITMWHVLEHVVSPEVYVDKIYALLNKHGKVVIEVPNFNSWTSFLTGKYWLGLDLNHHINFFTPESLSCLLKKYNFRIKFLNTFSMEHSTFTSAQSLVSLLTSSNHLFFHFLQTSCFNKHLILHGFLFVLVFPACFFINIILYFSKRGEVLHLVAEKE